MIYEKTDMFNNFPYILNRKTSSSIKIWLFFLIIGVIVFILIARNYRYDKYETYLGYVKKVNEYYYVLIYVLENEISDISNYKLYIDSEKEFIIESISDEYYILNNKNYYQVLLKTDLDENQRIDNNILNLKILKYKTTIYEEIKKGIKTWIN